MRMRGAVVVQLIIEAREIARCARPPVTANVVELKGLTNGFAMPLNSGLRTGVNRGASPIDCANSSVS